jgi:hypothetical protein
MIVLYHGTGAQDFVILDAALSDHQWARVKADASRLLRARGSVRAADILDTEPFQVSNGTNDFQDEFCVLHRSVVVEDYAEMEATASLDADRPAYRDIANALSEVGSDIRFVAIVPDFEAGPPLVPSPQPAATSSTVERALRDAQLLLQSSGAASAVDRVHTAIHGYLKLVCERSAITMDKNPSLTQIFKALREEHPRFQTIGPRPDEVFRALQAISNILDALNTLRNRASVAHPNEQLLGEAEAILVINCGRTLMHYLEAKLK